MLMYGKNTMKCLVVGNSPSVIRDDQTIDSFGYIIRNKLPEQKQHVGAKTDMFVSRTRKVNLILCDERLKNFKYKQIHQDPCTEPHPGELMIYFNNTAKIDLSRMKEDIGLNDVEKPTIGIVSIFIGLQLFGHVTLTGIEHDFNSVYIDSGHYDQEDYKRVNDYHNIYKEMLYIRKNIRENKITPL